jgi:hypothetical protein
MKNARNSHLNHENNKVKKMDVSIQFDDHCHRVHC